MHVCVWVGVCGCVHACMHVHTHTHTHTHTQVSVAERVRAREAEAAAVRERSAHKRMSDMTACAEYDRVREAAAVWGVGERICMCSCACVYVCLCV